MSVELWIVDAGHGGADSGAIGNGIVEKTAVLEIAKLIKSTAATSPNPPNIKFTRLDDTFESPNQKAASANHMVSRLGIPSKHARFLSLHYNSYGDPNVRGFEVFSVGSDRGEALATLCHAEIYPVLRMDANTPDRGVKVAPFTVLKNTSMPAALIEFGFLSNAQDAKYLPNAEVKQRFAEAIVYGVMGAPRPTSILPTPKPKPSANLLDHVVAIEAELAALRSALEASNKPWS